MNTNKMKLWLLLLLGIIASPGVTEASRAVQLSETSALFAIDFTLNDNRFVTAVPVTAKAGAVNTDRIDDIGYKLQKRISAEHNPITSAAGIVLAPNLAIVDGRYQVPKGSTQTFTLLVVASFTNKLTDDYQALITKLPYFIEGRRTTLHQNQLDTIEPALLTIK